MNRSNHFISFLKGKPAIPELSGFIPRLKLFAWILPLMLLVIILSALLQMLLVRLGITDAVKSTGMIPDYMRTMPSYRIILEIVILAPLLEETAFRGVLQRRVIWFKTGIFSLTYLMVCRILELNFYEVTLATSLIFCVASFTFLLREKSILPIIAMFDRPPLRAMTIWCSAIAFGFWHYYNFDFSDASFFTILISLLPFIINGLLLSYVAVKGGLPLSILLHMANNAWPLLFWL
ncbi:CPBP family intramembrane metalloprotease [Flavobacterium sp. Sd200]|uniref:CPBP family glutamic-type intramembrane protease n=1 Tax=Flavobacterium sp. Sd200 TaxID=2692211 RepID=UPI001370ADBB|nr:CPBP family glutamic-type intramembrane protease [Flavobacterium sp. Sd200]MXN91132.1 CPBP family intramembrane metalloprotease [Flavobacterium sp. Sd200]